eukprot:m51a1_g875 putative retinoblastoma-like protein 1 (953) ;mRNA; r:866110-869814
MSGEVTARSTAPEPQPQQPQQAAAAAAAAAAVGPTSSIEEAGITVLAALAQSAAPLPGPPVHQHRLAVLQQYSDALGIEAAVVQYAKTLLSRLPPASESSGAEEAAWPVCALYVAGSYRFARLRKSQLAERASVVNSVNLSRLLREAHLPIATTLEPLKAFVSMLKLGREFEEQQVFLEKNFVVTYVICVKYGKMLTSHLRVPVPSSRAATSDPERIFLLGWYLYVLAKARLLSDPPELVQSLYLLLCCVHLVITHSPPQLLRVGDPSANPIAPTFEQLCPPDISAPEALKFHNDTFVPFLQRLNSDGVLAYAATRASPLYLEGLLDMHLQNNVRTLAAEYERYLERIGDFDEIAFVDQRDQHAGNTSGLAVRSQQFWRVQTQADAPRSGLPRPFGSPRFGASPAPGVPPPTPMRAMTLSLSWLSTATRCSSPEPGPSARLLDFIRVRDLAKLFHPIKDRVNKLIQSTNLIDHVVPPNDPLQIQRRNAAVCLFYRFLESLLVHESRMLEKTSGGLQALLSQDCFAASLLAISVEIVVYTNKVMTCTFPRVLEMFNVAPLDFFKIIESINHTSEELPDDLQSHFKNLEDQVIESLGWRHDSRVFDLLAQTPTESIRKLVHSYTPVPVSPRRVPPSPMPPQPLQISRSLETFLRRVLRTGFYRLQDLCNVLKQSRYFTQSWEVFKRVISDRHQLLRDRHLDQIVMCTAHIVLHANKQRDVKFSTMIRNWKKMPTKVYKEVPLSDVSHVGDIITFYNEFFVPESQGFVSEMRSLAPVPPESPGVLRTPDRNARMTWTLKDYRTPMTSFMSPVVGNSSSTFSIGHSPFRDLNAINKSVVSHAMSAERVSRWKVQGRRLNFEVDKTVLPPPSADDEPTGRAQSSSSSPSPDAPVLTRPRMMQQSPPMLDSPATLKRPSAAMSSPEDDEHQAKRSRTTTSSAPQSQTQSESTAAEEKK